MTVLTCVNIRLNNINGCNGVCRIFKKTVSAYAEGVSLSSVYFAHARMRAHAYVIAFILYRHRLLDIRFSTRERDDSISESLSCQ